MNKLTVIKEVIDSYVEQSELNKGTDLGVAKIFDSPIIGAARADDPLFLKLKETEVIGPNHRLPKEWLPSARTVISYFLPFSKELLIANRASGFPALEWVGKNEAKKFNSGLRDYLVEQLEIRGEKAIAPNRDPEYKVIDRRSNWSEKHSAYICGLGSFGQNTFLITSRGCAGRLGSVITSMELEVTSNRYRLFLAYCRECGKCFNSCPVGAMKPEGKDNELCTNYLKEVIKPNFSPHFGCGKCQVLVPCASLMPQAKS